MTTARRIQVGILLIVLLVMTACGLGILVTVRDALVGQVDAQLTSGAEALGQIGARDPEGQIALLQAVAEQPDRESALLAYGPSDELVLSVASGTGTATDPLPDIGRVGVDGLRSRTGRPFELPAVAGSIEYRVVSVEFGATVMVIARPLDDVHDALGRLVFALLVSAAVAVAVIGVAISIVIRRAIRPIDDMIDVAAAIGRGDLSQRIATSSQDSDVLRLSDALDDMLHQLDDAFARKKASEERLRRFVADASHELRTPMASIRGYSELYLTGAATDDDAVERAMSRIRSEAVRTGELVEDLLLLARLDQGREPVIAEVDLTRLVTDCVADAKAIEPERIIELKLPDSTVTAPGDESGLRQVVANLLANTRAHAPGAPVHVTLTEGDREVAVVVADAGPGLGAEDASRVFDRFWRADEARTSRVGGSGLGLSIVAAVVEAHNGTIGLDTASGEGATFTVTLPGQSTSV